jgi:tetratricopeptide (TPR) repeat protein
MSVNILTKSGDVTVSKSLLRKCIFTIAVIAILLVSPVSGQRNSHPPLQSATALTTTLTESNELYSQIRKRVTDLEYSEETADDFVTMVSHWKTPRGQSVVSVLERILVRAREAYGKGQISKIQLAQTEEKAVVGLGQSIQDEITYRKDYFDLAEIIEERQANCFGYSQLFCVLGNSLGLTVSAMNVTQDHVANIVSLSDGTMTAVDLIRTNGFLSERIITDSKLKRVGSYWKYKDKNHITREGKIIHILDRNELISEIHFCRGTMQYMSGRGAEAITQYDRAIELSPQCARAYNNRGGAYLILSEHSEAISDFNKAIELSPNYVSAYHNRANAYLDSEQYVKAIADYTRAIELDPTFVKAYFGRGYAHLALEHYNEAISDYTRAIQLNPTYARAYYTRSISYAQLGERDKAIQDMLHSVALDHTLKTDVEKASAEFDLNLKLN